MRALAFLLLAAALAVPTTAAARLKPWLGVSGSWATYSMTDVNSELNHWNLLLAGTGLGLKEINGGFGFGLELGVPVMRGFHLGAGYDHLSASSDVSDSTGALRFKMPANIYRLFTEYRPPLQGTLGARIGVSAGILAESGEIVAENTGESTTTAHLHGTAPVTEVYAGADWWAVPRLALTATLGVRKAKIKTVYITSPGHSYVPTNPDGTNETIDYGGIFARLGAKFAFTK
jgi:hypothetical protein